ncbi:RNA polymerase sigma factor [Streptomyces siamensis]|uniref:Sigma-70 family RNA polymerase sigma factor n=1 Tax=Streptomyces siamensis TaxID=1274986 RepID=A0ABP9JI35_9ACTN
MTGHHRKQDEFEAFYRQWYANGVRYGRGRHRLQQWEAEAATQEAMSQMWVKWEELREYDSDQRRSYFLCILHRRCVDIIGDNVRRRRTAAHIARDRIDHDPALRRGREPQVTDGETLPENAYEITQLKELMAKLPEQQRLSVQLEHDGYPAAERAVIKGISENLERQHLARGRAKAKRMRDEGTGQ